MKFLKQILLALLLTSSVTGAEAKSIQAKHVYMFGFSASFKDSVVYITDIQDIPGAWIDSQTKFLLSRDNYAYQLRNYMTDSLGLADRVNMVMFALKKHKAEKLYEKLRKKYLGSKKKPANYDVRYVSQQDFRFELIDMSPE